jgi:hypothetical protein
MSWRNEGDVLLDRFDARNLMDFLDGTREGDYEPTDDEERAEIEKERYRDLNEEEEEDEGPNKRGTAIGFNYLANSDLPPIRPGPQPVRTPSPEPAPPPKPTTKQLEIILKTASFLASSANPQQAEILIQAKQASNPDFSFLNARDPLHAEFRKRIAMARLGVGYDSDSDNEEPNEEDPEQKKKYALIEDIARTVAGTPTLEPLLLSKQASDPRFSFLNPEDQEHGTFRARVAKAKADAVTLAELIDPGSASVEKKAEDGKSDEGKLERARKAREAMARKKANAEGDAGL